MNDKLSYLLNYTFFIRTSFFEQAFNVLKFKAVSRLERSHIIFNLNALFNLQLRTLLISFKYVIKEKMRENVNETTK